MAGLPAWCRPSKLTATQLRRAHAWATIAWMVLAVPTVLWWRDSVFWVSAMSWYAIVVSHAGAWQSTRAEEAAEQGPTDPRG